jgi:hypothetical protein
MVYYPVIPFWITYSKKVEYRSWALVAYTCNPSYSVRDQDDGGLKPAQANSSHYSISKNTQPKKGWWSGSSGGVPA